MNKFIQVFDSEYAKQLEAKGLRVVSKNDKFTLMTLSDKFNYDNLDTTKVVLTQRMTF